MKNTFGSFVVAALLMSAVHLVAAPVDDLTQWVDPLIGTDNSSQISHGDTLPTVALPFGMASWTPQTTLTRWIYLYKSGTFQGIRLTHQPSPWIGDYGEFTLSPVVGGQRSRPAYVLDHEKETATPYSYTLETSSPSITSEVTSTMRAGVMRFTFARELDPSVLLDVPGLESTVRVDRASNRVSGSSSSNTRGVPKDKPFACYFVIEADQSIIGSDVWEEKQPPYHVVNKSGRHAMALLRFGKQSGKPLSLKIGTSFISLDQAMLNLNREIGGNTFDDVRAAAKAAWQKELSRMEVEGASTAKKCVFYTALYRALLYPRTFYEYDRSNAPTHYSPYDGAVHQGVLYTDNGFWDTFRTVYPFFTVFCPDRLSEMLQGFVNAYKEGGWLPQWQSPGYQNCMIGTHSDSIFADAVVKGIRGFDVPTAYRASLKNADVPSARGQFGRLGLEFYRKLGYVPVDKMDQATSRTLEYAYDDFCLSQFAGAIGRKLDQKRFLIRSKNYRNVFNPATGFMQGRLSNGAWREPFDPFEWGREVFAEGNAWQHTWFVPHDPQGLIQLMGGAKAFSKKLDELFALPSSHPVPSNKEVLHDMREMVEAKLGQYHHGNQPSHHIAYLYTFAGEPWKTQERVRDIMARLYRDRPDGLPGDEDNGEMSAWFLFSSMGFYPVSPSKPVYTIGSPLFKRVTVRLANGATFVVTASDNSVENIYVQSAQLNGRRTAGLCITHSDILGGGELKLVMGPKPSTDPGLCPD